LARRTVVAASVGVYHGCPSTGDTAVQHCGASRVKARAATLQTASQFEPVLQRVSCSPMIPQTIGALPAGGVPERFHA
jgi:hypothetical protein